jgi:hypothetical protein
MLNPGRDWRTALIFGNLTHEGPQARSFGQAAGWEMRGRKEDAR